MSTVTRSSPRSHWLIDSLEVLAAGRNPEPILLAAMAEQKIGVPRLRIMQFLTLLIVGLGLFGAVYPLTEIRPSIGLMGGLFLMWFFNGGVVTALGGLYLLRVCFKYTPVRR